VLSILSHVLPLDRTPFLVIARTRLLRGTPWVGPAPGQAELVLPMPRAPLRLGERGFNQAREPARRRAPRETEATLLLPRTRQTPSQSGLARAQRLRNLRAAPSRPSRCARLPCKGGATCWSTT
jgi:hypothetical protein